MSIPSSVTQLLVLLVLIVPGFVYQAVRIQLRGRAVSDSELSTRIITRSPELLHRQREQDQEKA